MFVTQFSGLSGFGAAGMQSTTTTAINYQGRHILDANGKEIIVTFDTPTGTQITQQVIQEATKKQLSKWYEMDMPAWVITNLVNYQGKPVVNTDGTTVRFKFMTMSKSPTIEEIKAASKQASPDMYGAEVVSMDTISKYALDSSGKALFDPATGKQLIVNFKVPMGTEVTNSMIIQASRDTYPDLFERRTTGTLTATTAITTSLAPSTLAPSTLAPSTLAPSGSGLPQVSTMQSQEVIATTTPTSTGGEKSGVNPVLIGIGVLGLIWLLGRGSGKRSAWAKVGAGE